MNVNHAHLVGKPAKSTARLPTTVDLKWWLEDRAAGLQELTREKVDAYRSHLARRGKVLDSGPIVHRDSDMQRELGSVYYSVAYQLGLFAPPVAPRAIPLAKLVQEVEMRKGGLPDQKRSHYLAADGSFDHVTKTVGVKMSTVAETRLILAHEIAHYLQDHYLEIDHDNETFTPVTEGHAIGVERLFAAGAVEYADALQFEALKSDALRLGAIYLRCFREWDFSIDEKLHARIEELGPWTSFPHALGNAVFLLAEREFGFEIYKQTLMGNFDFLHT